MAKYQWKNEGPKPAVDAQVFGTIIEQIAGDLVSAKPEDIVAAARPRKSPIHGMFEWNDDKAAELYRRVQARHFVGALQIVRVDFAEGPTVSNRAFYSIQSGDRTGYMQHDRILSDHDLKKQLLDAARKELENYVRKFGSVMALGNFIPRLQEIINEMQDTADGVVASAKQRPARAKHADQEAPATTVSPA